MQTKKQSFLEAITNTAIGFGISYASTFLIFPLVGLKTSAGTNLLITIYFTVISIIRGYVIRRWFNKKKPPHVIRMDYDLQCFECEIEMPVNKIEGKLYCANCGLIYLNDYNQNN